MIDSFTNGSDSTCSNTWVTAFVFDTGFISRAVRVENAFRFTSKVGITEVFWQAGASTIVTHSVGTAW